MRLGMVTIPVISALRRQKQEDGPPVESQPGLHGELQANQSYIV